MDTPFFPKKFFRWTDCSFQRSELFVAEEVFISGTVSEIVAVTRIDHRSIGNGKPGMVIKRIQDEFRQIVEAKNEKYLACLEPVI